MDDLDALLQAVNAADADLQSRVGSNREQIDAAIQPQAAQEPVAVAEDEPQPKARWRNGHVKYGKAASKVGKEVLSLRPSPPPRKKRKADEDEESSPAAGAVEETEDSTAAASRPAAVSFRLAKPVIPDDDDALRPKPSKRLVIKSSGTPATSPTVPVPMETAAAPAPAEQSQKIPPWRQKAAQAPAPPPPPPQPSSTARPQVQRPPHLKPLPPMTPPPPHVLSSSSRKAPPPPPPKPLLKERSEQLHRPDGVQGYLRAAEAYRPGLLRQDSCPRFGNRSLNNQRKTWWYTARREAVRENRLAAFFDEYPEPFPKPLPHERLRGDAANQ
eukprot:TRINITY_DN77196_c0_g1_i1.p1 TRINITY_DN77196_c0_g1~~TRINITY_DN77196_c0_g1_i1.p1  ORF type:complete len:329 (+),score=87.65 TRINITY_DN77196_c0_g1_i1:115-1101(+)